MDRQKDQGSLLMLSLYRKRAIITRGLYIFYPILYYGLYFRAVYYAKRLIFNDSFLYTILLYLQYLHT